jgi:DNA replication protein DnaC
MLNEQTHQKLAALNLWGMDAAFQNYLDTPGGDALGFDERFGMLVDREWNDRQERHLKRRLQAAKLREPACIEDINFRHPRTLDRSVVQRLSTGQWVRNHENIIITGPTGIGKTWLACAFAQHACREGHSSLYCRSPRLLHDIAIARADGTYGLKLARLAKTDVLVLDEWGLAPLGDNERRDILEILDDRYGRRSTIVTSQYPVKKWHEYIGDPTIADSILDRLVHNAHRMELVGRTMRGEMVKGKDTKTTATDKEARK